MSAFWWQEISGAGHTSDDACCFGGFRYTFSSRPRYPNGGVLYCLVWRLLLVMRAFCIIAPRFLFVSCYVYWCYVALAHYALRGHLRVSTILNRSTGPCTRVTSCTYSHPWNSTQSPTRMSQLTVSRTRSRSVAASSMGLQATPSSPELCATRKSPPSSAFCTSTIALTSPCGLTTVSWCGHRAAPSTILLRSTGVSRACFCRLILHLGHAFWSSS